MPQDFRHPARLPSGIKTYFVASALIETHYDSKVTNLLGDSLVSVASALGEDDGEHNLFVPEGRKAIWWRNYMGSIHSRRVREQSRGLPRITAKAIMLLATVSTLILAA